jgi:hypothetical protein
MRGVRSTGAAFFIGLELWLTGRNFLLSGLVSSPEKPRNNTGSDRITLQKGCFFYINNFWSDFLQQTETVVSELFPVGNRPVFLK